LGVTGYISFTYVTSVMLFYSDSGTVLYAVNSELCAVYGSVSGVIVGPITVSFDLRPVYKSLLLCAVQSKHCITFLNLIW